MVDQGRQFYNKLIQKLLDDNGISMYSTFSKSKSVVAKRFIRTFKGKIYKTLRRLTVVLILVI